MHDRARPPARFDTDSSRPGHGPQAAFRPAVPDRQGADRRRRHDHAVELAAQPDHLQGRAGTRRRLHHGAEALRRSRRSTPSSSPRFWTRPACRRACSTSSTATARASARRSRATPTSTWCPSPARPAPASSWPRPRPTRSSACIRSSAASRPTSCSGMSISQAVTKGVAGCFSNSGQSCNAPTRMFVPRDRCMTRLPAMPRRPRKSSRSAPRRRRHQARPGRQPVQFDKIQDLIQAGIDEGATLVAGGPGRPAELNRGYYVRPTVFADVTHDMRIAREEIFGPVLAIMPYDSVDEVVEHRQRHRLRPGLLHPGQGHARRAKVAARMRTGNVYINYPAWDAGLPFGGYKQSGNGREYAEYGLEDFLEIKGIQPLRTQRPHAAGALARPLAQFRRDDRARCAQICRTAFDLGITHFDLANNYGPPPGSAETAFGEILPGLRSPPRRTRDLDEGRLPHVAGPLWRMGQPQISALQPRPEPEADEARLCRYLLFASLRSQHAPGRDDGRARCRRASGQGALCRPLLL
jgi:hypothetical protein